MPSCNKNGLVWKQSLMSYSYITILLKNKKIKKKFKKGGGEIVSLHLKISFFFFLNVKNPPSQNFFNQYSLKE